MAGCLKLEELFNVSVLLTVFTTVVDLLLMTNSSGWSMFEWGGVLDILFYQDNSKAYVNNKCDFEYYLDKLIY